MTLLQCKNVDDEAATVGKLITDLHKSGKYCWGDFAILYRLRNVSPPFEKLLKALSVPYAAVGKVSLTDREEVKDILVCAQFTLGGSYSYSLTSAHRRI